MTTPIWQNKSLVDLPDERWADIDGYTGCYQVSNMGRIKALQREISNPIHGRMIRKEKILSQWINEGYLTSYLYKDGKKRFFTVHILVATYFVPNTENKPETNHKRGIKLDNRASELEWVTESENMKHSYDIGLHKGMLGECHPSTSLTNAQVLSIFQSSKSYNEIAKQYKISKNVIGGIKTGRSWGHLTGKKYRPSPG